MASPWLRLAANVHADARVHRAKARTIWPWVLCRLKDGDGVASDTNLDPWKCSVDHDELVTEEQCAAMLASLKRVGLLVECEGGWTTPGWTTYQGDPTAAKRQRESREKKKNEAETPDERHGCHSDKRDVTDVTPQDTTGQDKSSSSEPPIERPAAAAAGQDGQEPIKPHVHTGEVFVEAPQLPQPSPEEMGALQSAWALAFSEPPGPKEYKTLLRWWRQTNGDIARIGFALRRAADAGKDGLFEITRYASRVIQSATPAEVSTNLNGPPARPELNTSPPREERRVQSPEELARSKKIFDDFHAANPETEREKLNRRIYGDPNPVRTVM